MLVGQRVHQRGFEIVGIPFNEETADKTAEGLQVLRYELDQEYQVGLAAGAC